MHSPSAPFLCLSSYKNKKEIKNIMMGERLEIHIFSQEIKNKLMERCSTSPANREMQMQTTRLPLTPTRSAGIKMGWTEGVRESRSLTHCCGQWPGSPSTSGRLTHLIPPAPRCTQGKRKLVESCEHSSLHKELLTENHIPCESVCRKFP